MKNDTRKITEGAMMVAIVGLMLFINRQLAGMIEYMMYWILTFPILIYTAKYGVKNAMVPSVCMLIFKLYAKCAYHYLLYVQLYCNWYGLWRWDKKRMEEWNADVLDVSFYTVFLFDHFCFICLYFWI